MDKNSSFFFQPFCSYLRAKIVIEDVHIKKWGFLGGSHGKESAWNVGELDSISGSERVPGEGNGNTLQYPCLENSMDRGAWWATVHGVAKSQARLSN